MLPKKVNRRRKTATLLGLVSSLLMAGCSTTHYSESSQTADTLFTNGYIYTGNNLGDIAAAIAIRDGLISYVGSDDDSDLKPYIGKNTNVIDLHGKMLMPGLVDAHMHPIGGGAAMSKCDLQFAALTVEEFQRRIQACLDADTSASDDKWLEVVQWYRQAMLPSGTEVFKETLDALDTRRPIMVTSSDHHTALLNSAALRLAGVLKESPNPQGGIIGHDASGELNGIFEDGAMMLAASAIPQPTLEDNIQSARLALKIMAEQGVTSFMDALSDESTLETFATLQKNGELTARANFAPIVTPEMANDPAAAVESIKQLQARYDQGALTVNPGLSVRHAKYWLDGVLQAPAQTAALLEPYLVKDAHSHKYIPGTHAGSVYIPPDKLEAIITAMAREGISPHIHSIGDRTTRVSLNSIEAAEQTTALRQLRPSIAHAELVDPDDFDRFAALNAIPVMSFQWAKPAPDSIDAVKDFIGPERFSYLEPEGSLNSAGARIAFGSDWPVDPFNEWFALKVGVTRTNHPDVEEKYQGTLNDEAGLSRETVLRAITLNAAYSLFSEQKVGSIEVGKFADLIVLNKNFMMIDTDEMASIQPELTMVGGKVVYQRK